MSTYQSLQSAVFTLVNYTLLQTAWLDRIWHLWIGLTFTGAVWNNHENKGNTHFSCKTNCTVVLAVYFTFSPVTIESEWTGCSAHSTLMNTDFDGEEQLGFFLFSVLSNHTFSSCHPAISHTHLITSKKWISLSQEPIVQCWTLV